MTDPETAAETCHVLADVGSGKTAVFLEYVVANVLNNDGTGAAAEQSADADLQD
jgi:hypothetical protein